MPFALTSPVAWEDFTELGASDGALRSELNPGEITVRLARGASYGITGTAGEGAEGFPAPDADSPAGPLRARIVAGDSKLLGAASGPIGYGLAIERVPPYEAPL